MFDHLFTCLKPLLVAAVVFIAQAKIDPFEEHNSAYDYTVKAALAAIISGFGGMIYWLKASHRRMEKSVEAQIKSRDEEHQANLIKIENTLKHRDAERERLWRQVTKLSKFQAMLENCPVATCAWRESAINESESETGSADSPVGGSA